MFVTGRSTTRQARRRCSKLRGRTASLPNAPAAQRACLFSLPAKRWDCLDRISMRSHPTVPREGDRGEREHRWRARHLFRDERCGCDGARTFEPWRRTWRAPRRRDLATTCRQIRCQKKWDSFAAISTRLCLQGIPAVYITDGVKAVDPKIDGLNVLKQWLNTRYHTPGTIWNSRWILNPPRRVLV